MGASAAREVRALGSALRRRAIFLRHRRNAAGGGGGAAGVPAGARRLQHPLNRARLTHNVGTCLLARRWRGSKAFEMSGSAKRQARLRERRAADGIMQMQVFVHKSRGDELRATADTMKSPNRRSRTNLTHKFRPTVFCAPTLVDLALAQSFFAGYLTENGGSHDGQQP